MDAMPNRKRTACLRAGLLALAALVGSAIPALAQAPMPSVPTASTTISPAVGGAAPASSTTASTTIVDSEVKQVYCPSCGGGLLVGAGIPAVNTGGCTSCQYGADCPEAGQCGCGGPCCHPGGKCCVHCDSDSWCGQCWCRFYNCICCPDPCYEPTYSPVSDAAFFVDSARPITQFRMGYDGILGIAFPDRAEYFWAQTGGGGKGPKAAERGTDINTLFLTTEVGAGRAGIVIRTPFVHTEPDINGGDGGFGDMSIAVKSLLLDCELLQFTFQMTTYIPTGKFTTGLGNGHTSLEPAFLMAAKLTPDTYLQAEMAEWIPLGGDPGYQGSILHYGLSLNHALWKPGPGLTLVGTLETTGWFFQGGEYSNPAIVSGGSVVPQQAEDQSFFSFGGGLRLVMCDKMDIGFAVAWGLNSPLLFDQDYRVEFRWRF